MGSTSATAHRVGLAMALGAQKIIGRWMRGARQRAEGGVRKWVSNSTGIGLEGGGEVSETRRVVRRGLSHRRVPIPTIIASWWARRE